MELKEIIPSKITVKLESIPVELIVNNLTLNDNVWLEEKYPGDELQKIYLESKMKDIVIIFARILSLESKRLIANCKIIEIDDHGNEKELEDLSIAEKLMRITCDGELALIIDAIYQVRVRSNDIAEKINQKYIDQKKTKEAKEQERLGN